MKILEMSRRYQIEWLQRFFKKYPLKKSLKYAMMTDEEIEQIYMQYYGHAEHCNIIKEL